MTNEDLYKAIGDIDDSYIMGAKKTMKVKSKRSYKIWGTIAACFCLVAFGAALINYNANLPTKPQPELVQVANPIMVVNSVDEMEKYLDFKVPVLDKEVEAYIVIVDENNYPKTARIEYKDGSTFNMEYGSNDVSGIFGGKIEKAEKINKADVKFYTYTDDSSNKVEYAIWEKDGFSYSLSNSVSLQSEIESLTK